MKRSIRRMSLVFSATLAIATPAMAIDRTLAKAPSPPKAEPLEMTEGRVSFTPFGFKKFCREERKHCSLYRKAAKNGAAQMQLTPKRRAELEEINEAVNEEISQIPEFSFFTASYKDEWKLPTNSGDCEDLALLKQKRLIDKGWPESALLVTVVDMADGVRHAVLTVRTEDGDLILDNITDEVKYWREVNYRWIKRQSTRNMMRWVEIVT